MIWLQAIAASCAAKRRARENIRPARTTTERSLKRRCRARGRPGVNGRKAASGIDANLNCPACGCVTADSPAIIGTMASFRLSKRAPMSRALAHRGRAYRPILAWTSTCIRAPAPHFHARAHQISNQTFDRAMEVRSCAVPSHLLCPPFGSVFSPHVTAKASVGHAAGILACPCDLSAQPQPTIANR